MTKKSVVNKKQRKSCKRRFFILAGHSKYDTGAVANGVREADLTIQLRNLVSKSLQDASGIVFTDNDYRSLREVVMRLKKEARRNDIILDIHFNSYSKFSVSGTEVFIPNKYTKLEYSIAKRLCNSISHELDIPNRGVKTESESARKRLAIMRPKASNILVEVCFISNKSDLRKYLANKKVIASKIANILLSA